METEVVLERIPYEEYRALSELTRAHYAEYKNDLRAILAFGDLVVQGGVYDIDILEVVAGWSEPGFVEYENSAELPLRGKLRLYFMSPEDFERAAAEGADDTAWASRLLEQVKQGYVIVLENPPGYASRILNHFASYQALPEDKRRIQAGANPLSPPSPPVGVQGVSR